MRNVKLKGLNNRLIAVKVDHVLFLDEHEIDGRLVTNIHFTNGKWVTSGHPLEEVSAMLQDVSEQETEAMRERWRERARDRERARQEIDSIVKHLRIENKIKSWNSHDDGNTKVFTIIVDKDNL